MRYDPAAAAAFYDQYGEREWTRFEDGRNSPLSVAVHTHYLRRFVRAGDLVLDAGAGPGRFTVELARLGARVVVADVSETQLAMNRARMAETGLSGQVVDWLRADIVDLASLASGTFDGVVCYGGPLSYVIERADDALDELLRVTRPGGHLLLSVMSLVGATAGWGYDVILRDADRYGTDAVESVISSGDLPPEVSGGHLAMHMYRWSELEALLARHGVEIAAASASSLSFGHRDTSWFAALAERDRERVIRWDIDLASERGALSSGEHIIAVARKPT